MAGERDRLLADPLHQAAVAGQHIGAVVDDAVAELGVEDALGQRHAHGVGEPLAERPRGRLDAGEKAMLGMAGGSGTERSVRLDVVDRDIVIAQEEVQGVEEHRAVAGRQHEAIAVRPSWDRVGRRRGFS